MAELHLNMDEKKPTGGDLVQQVFDPEIARFEKHFATKSSGGSLTPMEREILRAFLWWKLEVDDG